MTDNNHPITPPPELVQEWIAEWSLGDSWAQVCQNVALVAACWGADQELEACLEWLNFYAAGAEATDLRAARRPKTPSLKERALQAWAAVEAGTDDQTAMAVIRRALEALPE